MRRVERRNTLLRSRDLARSLQDSLLPPVLRPAPGLDAAARYLPATAGGESVTGDFYDLFQAHGPWWAAVMGDVCGKGTEAAKVTALARYTVRADAGDHRSPAEVLQRLSAAMLARPRAAPNRSSRSSTKMPSPAPWLTATAWTPPPSPRTSAPP